MLGNRTVASAVEQQARQHGISKPDACLQVKNLAQFAFRQERTKKTHEQQIGRGKRTKEEPGQLAGRSAPISESSEYPSDFASASAR